MRKHVFYILLFSSLFSAPFSKRTEFGEGKTLGMSWGDANGDGWVDLMAEWQGPNWLFLNNKDGTFIHLRDFGGTECSWAGAWGDYDGDGDLDVAIANRGDVESKLYRNNGDGTFTLVRDFGIGDSPGIAWIDVENDGDLDVLKATSGMGIKLYKNMGNGEFMEMDVGGISGCRGVYPADFNNDGYMDFLALFYGPARLYFNNGDGTFHNSASDTLGNTRNMISATVADFNNDGNIDVAIACASGGQNMLYINNGKGVFTSFPKFGKGNSRGISAGDYNNDGFVDVVVLNWEEPDILYAGDGNGAFTPDTLDSDSNRSTACAWADFDNDGDLDLAVGTWDIPKNNFLYINITDNKKMVSVSLKGKAKKGYTNSHGIGAVVTFYDENWNLIKREWILSYGGGYSASKDLKAYCALENNKNYKVVVEWPVSGIVDTLNITSEDKCVIVYENREPLPFTLISPVGGKTVGHTPIFIWKNSEDPDGDRVVYKLFIDKSITFDSPLTFENLADTSFSIYTPLEEGVYYWKVQAIDEDGGTTENIGGPGWFVVSSTGINQKNNSTPEQKEEIKIYDISGRKIKVKDTELLHPGVYFIKDKESNKVRKLIIIR